MAYVEFNAAAGSWNYPTSNPAPLEQNADGTLQIAFDDTTEEFIVLSPAFELPDNLDTSGTIYWRAKGRARTADGNEIQVSVYYSVKAVGEDWNAYTQLKSGDYNTHSLQDQTDEIDFQETVANLGFSAKDLLRLKFSRCAIVDGTKLSGDWMFENLKIRIPVT